MNVITTMTETGIKFEMMPVQENKPAPTLMLFAMSGKDTLVTEPYCLVGERLHSLGWNIVSCDLPCHGDDIQIDEPTELRGWAYRIAHEIDIIASFQAKINYIVNHLIENGISDPSSIAAAGTSRGGFMAFHAAIGNPLIRAVAAFSPVTDLFALIEFAENENSILIKKTALTDMAEKFADRDVWITIGNADTRVDSGKTIDFANKIKMINHNKSLQLHVVPVPGHCSLPQWHIDAAVWLNDRFKRK